MSSPLFLVYYKFTPVILTYQQVIINNFTPLTILLFIFVIQIKNYSVAFVFLRTAHSDRELKYN
jgi:hypothetical protein